MENDPEIGYILMPDSAGTQRYIYIKTDGTLAVSATKP